MEFLTLANASIILTALILFQTVAFLLSVIFKNNSLADVAWGLLFSLSAVLAIFLSGNLGLTQFKHVILMQVCLWSLRLSIYIFFRNKGKGDDKRYVEWSKKWGKYYLVRSYLQIFVFQAIVSFIVALPVIEFMLSDGPNSLAEKVSLITILGLLISLFGLMYETIADLQLFKFKKLNNKGVLDAGLWKYSRHPNYFGEILVWWGIFIAVISLGTSWLTVIGPLLITFNLVKGSGVRLTEKGYKGNSEYDKYKRSTSSLIPLPPKNSNKLH